MAYEQTIFAALSALTAPGKVWPATIPQQFTYPAIRYTVTSGVPFASLCEQPDEETDEIHIQLDLVARTHPEALALMRQVRAAMDALTDPPTILDDWAGPDFDAETKSYTVRMDYSLHGSS